MIEALKELAFATQLAEQGSRTTPKQSIDFRRLNSLIRCIILSASKDYPDGSSIKVDLDNTAFSQFQPDSQLLSQLTFTAFENLLDPKSCRYRYRYNYLHGGTVTFSFRHEANGETIKDAVGITPSVTEVATAINFFLDFKDWLRSA